MGKKIRDEDLVLNIIVNGDRGKKEIGQLERAIRDTRKELDLLQAEEKKMRAEGKKDTAQYKAVTAAIKQKNTAILTSQARIDQLRKGLKLTEMSYKDLKREITRLRHLRDAATPHTAAWKKHDAQLQIVKARYQQLTAQSAVTNSTLGSLTSGFSRMLGTITAGIASFYALAFGIKRASDTFIEFDDKIADVQKTTSLTKEEVLELNEALKDTEVIDTRTSQEGLLGLMRIAGKLGIEGKENLLGFTKAADEIAVALTEDLGGDIEKSINTIGKLVDVFDVDEEFGIETAMRKTGSVINELGANSSASEEDVVDFMSRMAGMGPTVKMSMADIAGLGSTLSQLKQSMEVAGTTFVNVIPKMFTNTAKFAEIARMGVDEFTQLLNTDANEAVIRFLEGLKNTDGLAKMMMLLKDLKLDGSRAKNILTAMANETDKLRKEQILSNRAFEEGSSITEEFNIKNTNAAALMAKSKKAVYNMWVELGEKLYPVLINTNFGFAKFLEIMGVFIDFVSKNWRIIVTVTAAIAAYNVVVALAAAKTWLFNIALRANPIGLIVSAFVAVNAALYLFSTRTKKAADAQKILNAAQEKANEALKKEELQIKSLLGIARDKSLSDAVRKGAIQDLIDIAPEYLGVLNMETIKTDLATDAVNDYIDAKKAQLIIDELITKQADLEARRQAARESIKATKKNLTELNAPENQSIRNTLGSDQVDRLRDTWSSQLNESEKDLQEIAIASAKIQIELDEINKNAAKKRSESRIEADRIAAEAKAKADAELKADEAKALAEAEAQRQEAFQKYRDKALLESKSLIDQERAAFNERLKLAGLFGKDYGKLQGENLAVYKALQKAHHANIGKIEADAISAEIKRRESAHAKELNALHIQQNEELKAFKGTNDEREKLLEQHHLQEEKLTEEYAQNLVTILQSVMDSGQWEGITADDILSDEEKAELEAKIEELKLLLSELGIPTNTGNSKGGDTLREDGGKDLGIGIGDTDILGFTPDQWEDFFANLRDGKIGLQELQMAVGALSDAWKTHNEFVKNAEDRQLQQYETNINNRKKALEDQLDNGRISQKEYNRAVQKLEADLDRKKAEFAHNQAKRERDVALMSAIVNTAAGVAKALGSANLALAIIIGIAGALQIGKIASTPLPEIPGREDGGYFDVQRSQDRKFFRAKKDAKKRGYVDGPTVLVGENGREFVASNEAYNNPTIRPVLDVIDTAQRNGHISTVNLERVFKDRPPVSMYGHDRGGYIRDDEGTPSGAGTVPASDPEMKILLMESIKTNEALRSEINKGIKATVSLLGKGGFYETEEEYNELQNNVNL